MRSLLLILLFGVSQDLLASTSEQRDCEVFLQTQLKYGPTHAQNVCKVFDVGGVCANGVSQSNQRSSDGTNQLNASNLRCAGILYGLAAGGTLEFDDKTVGCGLPKDGAHKQCVAMLKGICKDGPYMEATKGGLCWWVTSLGSNKRTDLFYSDDELNTEITKLCYGNATENPFVYSAVTGCAIDDVQHEED